MTRRRMSRATAGSPSAIPASMNAAAIVRFGPPSMLTLHDVPVPTPGPHEVLIALELRPGHTVLIFGTSGAVGTMAVQFAAQRGAHVIATASGSAAARLVRALGAHRVSSIT